MKNGEGIILYVGKAKNLKNRVRNYFTPGQDGREMVPFLTSQVVTIDTIVVRSEKEALLLENTLIKKHKPKYNALLKDDKNFFSLELNCRHPWPLLRVVRFKGRPPKGNLYFGPYTNGYAARQTLELLRQLFPLRQCSDRELLNRTRPCILYDMKRCIAPCVGKCSKEAYDTQVKRVIQFLRGHDTEVVEELKEEMREASEELEFEKANRLYHAIESIKKTVEKQQVVNMPGDDLDAIGLYREADRVSLTLLEFREGKLSGSIFHIFEHNAQEDSDLLSSFLLQNYADKEFLPKEILLPLDVKEQALLAEVLTLKIHKPEKGDKRQLVKMAMVNAQTHFQKEGEIKNIKEPLLLALEETFHLTHFPEKIECFDNSHISGSEPVSAMVVFINGEKNKKSYRKFRLHSAPADDYGALKEVLSRRYKKAKEEDNLPDLILIDGGKGHLNLALEVLSELNISTVDVLGIAKEEGRHDRGSTQEQIYIPEEPHPLLLTPHSPLLFFLQQIRDEAHRFAITFQRNRRSKKSLESVLDTLPGIGPLKKKRLLKHFGSLKRILEATEEELKAIPGIQQKDIATLQTLKKRP